MDSVLPIPAGTTIHRIRRIQVITIAWMSVEAVVSLAAAWMAHSPALLAFGGDSARTPLRGSRLLAVGVKT